MQDLYTCGYTVSIHFWLMTGICLAASDLAMQTHVADNYVCCLDGPVCCKAYDICLDAMGYYRLADALEDVGKVVEAEAQELAKERMKIASLGVQNAQVHLWPCGMTLQFSARTEVCSSLSRCVFHCTIQ